MTVLLDRTVQRAVLILCEVMRWKADEAAEMLGTTTAAVNSALQRARAHLEEAAPSEDAVVGPTTPEQRDLLDRYVAAFESYDVNALVQLFSADAVWEMPANPAMGLEASVKTGRSDIAAGVRERRSSGVQGPRSGTWHSITTQQIEVSGDEASGRVYYQFLGKVDGKPSMLTLGRYADRYVRTADGWRLAHRTIHLG